LANRALQRVHQLRGALSLLLVAVIPVQLAHGQSPVPLRLESQLRIDGNAANLAPIAWLAVRGDGVIAVAQQQDGAVRFYDARGSALGAVGKTGDGPGEFRSLGRAGWIADTMWVYDGPRRRFTFISPQQTVLRTVPRPGTAQPAAANPLRLPEFKAVYPRALHADGSMLVYAGTTAGPLAAQYDETQSTYLRIASDGTIQRLVAKFPASSGDYVIRAGRDAAGGTFPLAMQPYYEPAPNGARSALVIAEPGAATGSVTLRVTMFGANGDTVYSVRHSIPGTAIPRAVADSIREGSITAFRARNPTLAGEYRRLIQIPPVYPPVSGIVVGSDGSLWIRQRTTAQGTPYLVLDPRGAMVGAATAPEGVDIRVVQGNTAWATARDRDDVQSIVRYGVAR
jgi:hypothetical protein